MSVFSVKATITALDLAAAETQIATFQVSNLTDVAQRIMLAADVMASAAAPAAAPSSGGGAASSGAGAPGITVVVDEPVQRNLAPRESTTVAVKVSASGPAGTHQFRLRAFSADQAPEATEATSEAVQVKVAAPTVKKRFQWWIPVAAGVVLIALIGAFVVFGRDKKVAVPNGLVGLTASAVAAELDKSALVPVPAADDLKDQAAFKVSALDPPSGTKVKKGSNVALTIERLVQVPRLKDLSFEDARTRAAEFDLVVTPKSIPATPAIVGSSEPEEGTLVKPNSVVVVTLVPPPPVGTKVPSFGTVGEARKFALAIGLKLVVKPPAAVDSACVTAQKPDPGQLVNPGDALTLDSKVFNNVIGPRCLLLVQPRPEAELRRLETVTSGP